MWLWGLLCSVPLVVVLLVFALQLLFLAPKTIATAAAAAVGGTVFGCWGEGPASCMLGLVTNLCV